MTVLENRGNAVKIHDTIIPAVNIQVEGVPGYIDCECGCGDQWWYGVYFEILFEDGSLWEVNYREKEDSNEDVEVTVYANWHCGDDIHVVNYFPGWLSFVAYYKDQKK